LGSFYHPSDFSDFSVNVILFIPFGFSLTYFLFKLNLKWLLTLILILLASFLLSFSVEALQAFLPSRSSTITDIIGNTIGGFIGLLCFSLANSKMGRQLSLFLFFSRKGLTVCLISYTTLILVLSIPLPRITNLTNWNPNFPLLLANETTGDNPWQGNISEVYIANKAITKNQVAKVFANDLSQVDQYSLVAHYQLIDKNNDDYRDQTGHSPSLLWQAKNINYQSNKNLFFDKNYWLSTEKSATAITNKIRQTSQFTLITTVATANINQSGPARIISLSGNHLFRNFALAQEGSSLVFRFRTPITTEDGTNPHIIIPEVFRNQNPHLIVVTYSDSVLKLYIDKPQNLYYLELTPLNAIISYLIPYQAYNLNLAKRIYFITIFIPLGLCLGGINAISKRKMDYRIALLFSTTAFLPAFFFELIYSQGRSISLNNIVLSLTIISATMLIVTKIAKFSRKTLDLKSV
jgi:glycopeptide antibiotics resistance protein